MLGERLDLQLPDAPQHPAAQLGGEGDRPVQQALRAGDGAVEAGHHPGRGALEEGEPADLRLDGRHDLDRGGAGAHHGDALAAQVVVVVPACGVEDLAGEGLKTGDARDLRVGQRPGGGDDDIGGQGAARGLDHPAQVLGVPGHQLDLGAEAQVRAQAEEVGDVLQVGADVPLAGEGARPLGVGRERERVQVGGHVAGAPGVAVVPPGAADLVGPLQDDEVGDPLAAQPHGGPQTAEAGPDHRHPYMLVLGHPGASTHHLGPCQ